MQADLTGRRVACFGECMLELRTRPDGLLSRGFGGDTLNTALYLARLGAAVDYVTALGDDDFSTEMLRAWEDEGIGTGPVRRIPGSLPGLYVIETDPDGERRFLYWRDAAPVRRLFDPPHRAATEDALAGAGLVYLSGISLSLFAGPAREALFAALERARAGGARIAFDTNFRPRGWPDLVWRGRPTTAWPGSATWCSPAARIGPRSRGTAHPTRCWPGSTGPASRRRW